MLGLGIFAFGIAAVLLFFAFKPNLAFFLDEGWKFRQKTEPSDLYVGANLIGRVIAAGAAIVVGFGAIGMHFSERHENDNKAATRAAIARCESEILPRFNETVKWDGKVLANPDEVRRLADELGVTVEIKNTTAYDYRKPPQPATTVAVSDPDLTESSKALFTYLGEYRGIRDVSTGRELGMPDSCYQPGWLKVEKKAFAG